MTPVEKRRRQKRLLTTVSLCLTTAVVISSAYILFLFRMTVRESRLESAHIGLTREHEQLENRFREKVREYYDFLEVTGFDEDAMDAERLVDLKARIANTLAFKGYLDDSLLGEPLLLPNVMTSAERDLLKALDSCDEDCDGYVDDLYEVVLG